MDLPRTVDRHGQFQYGLITRKQMAAAGLSRQERRTVVEAGVLVPVDHGVYRSVGAPIGWEQRLLAACLAGGPEAVASHQAAALVWDLVDPPAPIEITVPYELRPLPATAIRHRTRALRDQDRTVRRHIPVTTPARTLLDLGRDQPGLVASALERCLFQQLLTTAALWRMLDEVGGRGRPGTRALRTALEQRALGDERPESLLEPLLAQIAVEAGIDLQYQFPVEIEGHRYRLDFALPHLLVACEVDGLSAHASRSALDGDLERQNRLVRHGWLVLRFTSTRLTRNRGAVRREILDAVDLRRSIPARPSAGSVNPNGWRATDPVHRTRR